MIVYDSTVSERYAQALFNVAQRQGSQHALLDEVLELFVGRWRSVLARRSHGAGRVGRGEMKLVHRDQRGLREVERGVVRRRNRHCGVHAVEDVVRKAAVLAAEHDCDRTFGREVEQLRGRSLGVEHAELRRAAPSGAR